MPIITRYDLHIQYLSEASESIEINVNSLDENYVEIIENILSQCSCFEDEIATIYSTSAPSDSFEYGTHSIFLIPVGSTYIFDTIYYQLESEYFLDIKKGKKIRSSNCFIAYHIEDGFVYRAIGTDSFKGTHEIEKSKTPPKIINLEEDDIDYVRFMIASRLGLPDRALHFLKTNGAKANGNLSWKKYTDGVCGRDKWNFYDITYDEFTPELLKIEETDTIGNICQNLEDKLHLPEGSVYLYEPKNIRRRSDKQWRNYKKAFKK